MIDVDVIVISMNEPQLDRCLRSLREQTYSFYRIININGVAPIRASYNRALDSVETEWFSMVGGDCIFYKDALANAVSFMEKHPHDRCCSYCLTLYDPFLELRTGFLCLARSSTFKQQKATDELRFDKRMMEQIRNQGWFLRKNMKTIAGTHFQDPDEFQVFHRFFILATKDGMKGYDINKDILTKLYERYKNSLYSLALDAMEFGIFKGAYGRSIDENYNRQMYEEFKEWKQNKQRMPNGWSGGNCREMEWCHIPPIQTIT